MKRLLTYVLILGGVMLAALSGCQKEEEIAGQEFNPISRLEAEKLIKGWNADRKGTLKSATTITITEGM